MVVTSTNRRSFLGLLRSRRVAAAALGGVGFVLLTACGCLAGRRHVMRVTLSDDIINPITVRYIGRGIQKAEQSNAECLIIQLDTPGGLMASTKKITSRIMNAKVPVVVYVAPQGAGAVSAGVFITTASHVAAMAPGTHIGAAHPVTGGGNEQQVSKVMNQKWENYAASYVAGMAEERHRNVKWVQQAVRKSASATAEEAHKLKVVEILAEDTSDLLHQLDGRKVKLADGEVTLHTQGAEVQDLEMYPQEQFLNRLAHPNIAYVLWTLALVGLVFEVTHPGTIFPGIVGAVCLILALFAFSALPINWAGAILMVLGIGLLLAEIKVPSHGVLTIGGVVAFVLGSLMLIDSPIPELRVPIVLILTVTAATAGFFIFAIAYGLRAQRRRVDTGQEGMIGRVGKVKRELDPEGTVFVRGEYWNARTDGDSIPAGRKVRVVHVDDMELVVEPVDL